MRLTKLVERPPLAYRMLFPETVWRIHHKPHTVYLTFDDGPIPEVTPWVLDTLDHYGVKATFFCVGENVKRNPLLFQEILLRGHSVGNHTMSHAQGAYMKTKAYLHNVFTANEYIHSPLFRPPHGLLRWAQSKVLRARFAIIMYDLVTRDYSKKLNGEQVLDNVKHLARNGSIIVFHDSLKAEKNMKYALPKAIEWLKEQGYDFGKLPM
ncbi:MAG: polysaccharide deacetylase family protein [Muribaculaceae bacterium]|nr:polysaccharide deacetylase family protein [Muribaculaceae bacterium]MBQ1723554.1 polysaccharide deacetylase family protein [Muribaculaceae bacterium]MBQ3960476.1 polysaccharide deacetylase family protein [Muribaculaceae bacterium]MBQ4007623.1 polysaccharide deacetylase family protein [Muribaculaceae bacterium]